MEPQEYELLVAGLLQIKLSREPQEIFSRKIYQGASGQRYEIDLSFEVSLADTRLVVLVECKCYRRPVGVDDLAEFAYKLHDIGAHKGIVVSTSGFQDGAINVAKREGIALIIAVDSWITVLPRWSAFVPRYVIRTQDGRLRRPKHEAVIFAGDDEITYLPMPTCSTQFIGIDTPIGRIAFIPEVEGFIGDPVDFLEAVQIFHLENEIPLKSEFAKLFSRNWPFCLSSDEA